MATASSPVNFHAERSNGGIHGSGDTEGTTVATEVIFVVASAAFTCRDEASLQPEHNNSNVTKTEDAIIVNLVFSIFYTPAV
jgi:hypothetical protein